MSLKSNIGGIVAGLERAQRRGLERSAVYVVDLARQLVPVDTSSLQRTIRSENTNDPLTINVVAGDETATNIRSGGPVNYAPYIEYGTADSAAQPFMTPAARAIKPEREIAAEVAALIKGASL